jgi:thiamine monophosphate synthase
VWSTATKTDTAAALGPEGADRLARAAHSYRRPGGVPGDADAGIRAVGIGGVTPLTVARLAATELDGVCVVSSIMAAPDPRAAAADLLARWDAARR